MTLQESREYADTLTPAARRRWMMFMEPALLGCNTSNKKAGVHETMAFYYRQIKTKEKRNESESE